MSEEDYNPYCEVCGTCGYIGCCGIRNFINEHIEGKTNCKNEEVIISELIDLCDYKDRVFEENEQLREIRKKAIEYLEGCGIDKEMMEVCSMYVVNGIELMNILQGGNNE